MTDACTTCSAWRGGACHRHAPEIAITLTPTTFLLWEPTDADDWCVEFTNAPIDPTSNCGNCAAFVNGRCQFVSPTIGRARAAGIPHAWTPIDASDWCFDWLPIGTYPAPPTGPPGPPAPSPPWSLDGSQITPSGGGSLTDGTGAVWTFSLTDVFPWNDPSNSKILRNGDWSGGAGVLLYILSGKVWAQASVLQGSGWYYWGAYSGTWINNGPQGPFS